MLILFIRAIVSFTLLLVVIRIMGKRQLGEMKPFELVITLVISELALLPVVDRNVPLSYGVITMLTMLVIHQVIVLLSRNELFNKLVSGKPIIVYTPSGIDIKAVRSLDLQVIDVLQSLRATGHFSLSEINYGIMETSGQLSVISNHDVSDDQQQLAVPVILEGKWSNQHCKQFDIDKACLKSMLEGRGIKVSRVLLLTLDCHHNMTLQLNRGNIMFEHIEGRIVRCPSE